MRNSGRGWVTAEYGMLPRATNTRNDRKRTLSTGRTARNPASHRTQLAGRYRYGRFWRAPSPNRLRCLTGRWRHGRRPSPAVSSHSISRSNTCNASEPSRRFPLRMRLRPSPAVLEWQSGSRSGLCGEDSTAQADANFVLTGSGGIVEVQGTAEGDPFSREQFDALLTLATDGIARTGQSTKSALGLQ